MCYHFAITLICFVFVSVFFLGGGGLFKCPCYRIIDDVIVLSINFCCDTINCNGDNEILFLIQIYLRSCELNSDVRLSFYFQKRYQIYFQNLRVCIGVKKKSRYSIHKFSVLRTLVVQKKIKVLWRSNITHVNLYSIYNVRSGNLHVVQKRYKQLEKNGITLAVYLFTKKFGLTCRPCMRGSRGKGGREGGGHGSDTPRKKKFLNLHSTMYIYNYRRDASDPLPGKMV